MNVTIRRCRAADIEAVLGFIDRYWQRGHVLVRNRMLLDWQYRNHDDSYSFVIAARGSEILGILGYIATSRYDSSLADDRVLWLTTWKVREDANVAGLGVALLQHLTAAEPHTAIGAIGFTPTTRPIYEGLGYRVGTLTHYVMANAVQREFALATLNRANPATLVDAAPLTAAPITDAAEFDALATSRWPACDAVPRKTPRYFWQRYAAHPVYAYRVLLLRDGATVRGLLTTRTAEHDGHRAVRIVDFLGTEETFGRCGRVVQRIVAEEDAEYADVYNAGLDPGTFARAGFRRVDEEGGEVVPDHFEPFERRNVCLRFSFRGRGPLTLFKADGDQDRPNRVGSPTVG